MEVHCLHLAEDLQIDDANRVDILKLFNYITTDGPPYRHNFLVIAKIDESPSEAGETKSMVLRVTHELHGNVGEIPFPYVVPSLSAVADETPYIRLALPAAFEFTGEYRFEMLVDEEVKAADWLWISDTKELQNGGT